MLTRQIKLLYYSFVIFFSFIFVLVLVNLNPIDDSSFFTCLYTDNNCTILTLSFPVVSYSNSDILKLSILNDNKDKSGIYRWTHMASGKSYVGSAINLHKRLKNYYNISYLEREVKNNNSMIYRTLLKYGYSQFSLDILEYCDISNIIEREQYYLSLLEPKYNIMKFAGSVLGLKHTKASIERIRKSNLGRIHTEEAKVKIGASSIKALSITVTQVKTGETKVFTSIRSAAIYTGLHHSYIAKCLKAKGIYKGELYTILLQNK